LAEAVLPVVRLVAQGSAADVALLHVAPLPGDTPGGWQHRTLRQLIRDAEREWQPYLSDLQHDLAMQGVSARTAVAVGDAAAEMVRYADQVGMNLIALATHGRSGLQRWLAGSIPEKVLTSTHTPLLLI